MLFRNGTRRGGFLAQKGPRRGGFYAYICIERIYYYRRPNAIKKPTKGTKCSSSECVLDMEWTRLVSGSVLDPHLHRAGLGPGRDQNLSQWSASRASGGGEATEGPPAQGDISTLCSHWSSSYITVLSLVESFIVMLRQLSNAIKNQ